MNNENLIVSPSAIPPLQQDCSLLCIRADNMGDLIMSVPAFRALKETYHSRLTVLTSSMGALITPFIKEIDETIIADVPWVKTDTPVNCKTFDELVQLIKSRHFDAAIIFTVYSQNSLPAAMLAFMANIPVRAAYCRENPYQLLTHWLPDAEPYTFIQHQVQRDLKLTAALGANLPSEELSLTFSEVAKQSALQKMKDTGVDIEQPWILLHPGVSEEKRKYPTALWTETITLFQQQLPFQLLLTGSSNDIPLISGIKQGVKGNCFSLAGLLSIEELIALISITRLVISVNTGTVHIAAAVNTPVVVLYALTNPQHTPWLVPHKLLYYSVQNNLKSRNEVVRYVSEYCMDKNIPYPQPEEIMKAVKEILNSDFIQYAKSS